MIIFQGVLFMFFGMGLLVVNYRALDIGWLPCGPNGFKGRLEVHRQTHPLWFWLLFSVYAVGGLALIVYAVRLFAGWALPLPLR